LDAVAMTAASPRTILVVANRTASTPALLSEVGRRAGFGCRFTLLIPPEAGEHADWTPDVATQLLRRAAGDNVVCVDAGPDAAATVHQIVSDQGCDEIIVSTVSEHHARWLHHDLPRRLEKLGVPVTVIPPEPDQWGPIEGFPPQWVPHAEVPTAL
jgi:hypothetical protein